MSILEMQRQLCLLCIDNQLDEVVGYGPTQKGNLLVQLQGTIESSGLFVWTGN